MAVLLGIHDGEIATAAPVWHELFYGCRVLPPSKKRRAIEKHLLGVVAPPSATGAAEGEGAPVGRR